jgi:hypothetical protein
MEFVLKKEGRNTPENGKLEESLVLSVRNLVKLMTFDFQF